MNVAIGDIIIDKIKDLPFVDKYAGTVKVLTLVNGQKRNTFPVACRATLAECEEGKYTDLIPNSSKKSILFLEDRGSRVIERKGNLTKWSATFDLICWLNLPKLGHSGCVYSTYAVEAILKTFPRQPFNEPNKFQRILINVVGQKARTVNPFSKYTFDEVITQFLMWPYDAFSLELEVSYWVDARCLVVHDIETEIPCDGNGLSEQEPEVPTLAAQDSDSVNLGAQTVSFDGISHVESELFKIVGSGLTPPSGNILITPSSPFMEIFDGVDWQTSPIIVPYTGGAINTAAIYKIRANEVSPPGTHAGQSVIISGGGATNYVIDVTVVIS